MEHWMIVTLKYMYHLKLNVCDYELLTMFSVNNKVYWNLSQWSEFSQALENCFIMHLGGDQDLICIMGGTRACTLTQMSMAILPFWECLWETQNKMETTLS